MNSNGELWPFYGRFVVAAINLWLASIIMVQDKMQDKNGQLQNKCRIKNLNPLILSAFRSFRKRIKRIKPPPGQTQHAHFQQLAFISMNSNSALWLIYGRSHKFMADDHKFGAATKKWSSNL